MDTLQRLLACSVVEALEQRQHVVIAPGGTDALLDEVEGIIAPSLPTITTHLQPNRTLVGEVTSTFGHEAADDAVEQAVSTIADQLMESDHVDDIFAEDRLIRRDAFRAIQGVLLRYVRGEIEVGDEEASPELCAIELDRLGYLVSTVAQRAEPSLIESSLHRAAQAQGVELVSWDGAERSAHFTVAPEGAVARLPLEEAITERFVDLVDADLVELPTMERILRMPSYAHQQEGFASALRGAARHTQQVTGCAAACTVVDSETLLATLTPLSDDASRSIEGHFETFLDYLEAAMAELATTGEAERPSTSTSEAGRASERASSGSSRGGATKSSSSRKPRRAASSKAAAKPSSSRKATRAASSKGAAKPPSSRKPARAASSKAAAKPPSSRKPTRAASSKGAAKPPSSRKPTRAASSKGAAKPPSSRKPTRAASSKGAAKPPSSRKPTRAASSKESTKAADRRKGRAKPGRKQVSRKK